MQDLTKGKEVAVIPYGNDLHETGIIVSTLKTIKENLREADQMRNYQHQLEEEGINERRKDMLALADQFESSILGIVEAVSTSASQLGHSAQALSQDADATYKRSEQVAGSMEAASLNVQSVAGATEEMSASSHAIADQAERAAQAANDAAGKAVETTRIVEDMNRARSKHWHGD